MKRISDLEKKYVIECLNNEFETSKGSFFTNRSEKLFSELYGIKYSISHCNGTVTLQNALNSLGISENDEVIVPPLTMSSTAISVLLNRSIPVFADVDKETFNIDPQSIEKLITKNTKAIMTVALYGLSPEYDKILDICKKHNLYLIEDNAQSFMSLYKNKLVGTFGDFASFSFQSSKHLTTGEGGMLITDNEELAFNARRFSSLGYAGLTTKSSKITKEDIQNPNYDRHVSLGYNFRMSEIQSAVLLAQLERQNDLVGQRIKTAELFNDVIKDCDFLKSQNVPFYCKNTWWSFSMILDTNKPEEDWFKFRRIFLKNGGDEYYAAWKLTYNEPLFKKDIQYLDNVWQKYDMDLCPVAEYLQPRMIQMKTNYWNIKEAEKQADILKKTIKEF
jgi:perosamine synthetase